MNRRHTLELFALSAFAIAQPLFVKLGPAPGYFAAHDLLGIEVVAFALVALLLPALGFVAIEAVATLVGERARGRVHLVLIALLVALVALPPLGALVSPVAYAAAVLLGIAAALLYRGSGAVRRFTTALAIGPVLFLVAFLVFSPAGKVIWNGGNAWAASGSFRPSVVFIQFDAFPSLLMETGDRRIDAARYPNLARLARDGTWYRNASNVHENTVFSVPSIVEGRFPVKGTKPVVQDHPQNLFTVLGGGYEMNVAEEATSLCPTEYCGREGGDRRLRERVKSLWRDTRVVFNQIVRPEDARDDLPPIDNRWSDFSSGPIGSGFTREKKTPGYVIRHLHSGRIGRYERWLARIGRGGAQPELDYIHMFLPHEPREFLPDGRRYVPPDSGLEGPPSYDKPYLARQEQQRVLLQLGYTDRVVGQILGRLRAKGLYDDALIVVVADHGESFQVKPEPAGPFVPGRLGYRRAVTRKNLADIASIPLFVKYPKGHGPAGVDDRYVRTTDILPTIAATIGLKLASRVDGRDLNDGAYRGHRDVEVATTFDGVVRMGVREWEARRRASLRERLALFGSGSRSLYHWGPQAGLLGRRVAELAVQPRGRATTSIEGDEGLADAKPRSPVCPCFIAGHISGAPLGMTVAVALNGRIVATSDTFADIGKPKLNWSALLPPSAIRAGRNDVRVYATEENRLTPLGSAP